jgi:hypothetical protein
MPNLQQLEQPADTEPLKHQALKDIIRNQVVSALGVPADLLKVQVREVAVERYRVNVLIGPNAGSAKVANSFFIVADANGRLISATPPIIKEY